SYEPAPGMPEPIFDPFILFIGQRAERASCRAALPSWVDTERCQYCHPVTGCIVPRGSRPAVCREYRCASLGG
ncbi:MAG: hypothetical protein Q7U75_00745, partial [Desulfobacterales bacterium]|nr:hypothetical protein [Desulfobacterales bacterium]